MSAEFDTIAGWTAQVALELSPDHRLPAGCRGSGNPNGLRWLLEACQVGPDTRLVDVGAGVGGPAGFAREHAGTRPLLVAPEQHACRAARSLFELPVVQASATDLPLPTGRFDVAWCLGVLCTAPDDAAQLAMLTELRRVVRPAGLIGLLVFVAQVDPARDELDDPPAGNHFPTADGLGRLLDRAGLTVVDRTPASELPEPPADWTERTEAVEDALRQRYGDREAYQVAEEQSGRIGRLLATGQLTAELLLVRAG